MTPEKAKTRIDALMDATARNPRIVLCALLGMLESAATDHHTSSTSVNIALRRDVTRAEWAIAQIERAAEIAS